MDDKKGKGVTNCKCAIAQQHFYTALQVYETKTTIKQLKQINILMAGV